MRAVSRFLRKCPKDISFINKLFVTSYIKHHHLAVTNSSLLYAYFLTDAEENEYLLGFDKAMKEDGRTYSFEDYIELFEFVISPSDKIVNGAVYTPKYIREYIEDYCFLSSHKDLSTCKIIDMSCGCGGFLVDAALRLKKQTGKSFKLIFQDNIFGIDIQSYSVERTKIMLSLLAVSLGEDSSFDFNIWQADTLGIDFHERISDYDGFDIIVGNPPYVCSRNMAPETKELMKNWSVCTTGHPDLYIPFFQIAMQNLSQDGVMGYITMNSFLKSLNGRAVRQYFQEIRKLIHVIDFRGKQVFRSKSTYTCLFFAENNASDFLYYVSKDNNSLSESNVYNIFNYKDLDSKKGWNLNNTQDIHVLENIGTPIWKFSQSRHGVATLCNKVYIFSPVRETQRYYILNKDGNEYNIEKGLCKEIVNPNKLNSDVIFENIIEKVIFPYRKDKNGKMQIIPETILQNDYPNAYHYLETQKDKLATRDKGKGKDYPVWYQFGRTQSLNMPPVKLFFPKIANRAPRCVLVNDSDLYLYNGMAFVGEDEKQMMILQKVFESSLFWNYLISNSKPYSSDYYSLNGEYIKNFGIYDFAEDEITYLLNETDREAIDTFLSDCYARK
jgi:methylase of polypeptide subunit release factors